jgi:hypothetical protein
MDKNPELNGPQMIALEAILSGCTVSEAAEKAGVSRKTVSGWRNHLEAFRHALEDGRAEIADHVRGRVLGLSGDALEVLVGIMRSSKDDAARIRAASRILDLVASDMLPTECRESPYARESRRDSERVAALLRGR